MFETLRRSIVTEEELYHALSCTDYMSFHDQVRLLVDEKHISPIVSSGMNGRLPPLYRKYRLLHPQEAKQDFHQEIRALHPSLSIERYFAKPAVYETHRDLLQPISAALWKQPEWWGARMSLNEKSLALYDDEKRMARDRMRLEGVLAFNRLDWSLFRIYETPEPFFSWNLPGDTTDFGKDHSILVLENKDIWYSLMDLSERLGLRTLFPEMITCLIYGEGNKVSRERGSLSSYLCRMFGASDACHVYYCGDLDVEGVRIWFRLKQANPELRLSLFAPLYREMVRWAMERTVDGRIQLPPSADERETTHLSCEAWQAFLLEACHPDDLDSVFGQPHTLQGLTDALAAGGRIPQEATNRMVLERLASRVAHRSGGNSTPIWTKHEPHAGEEAPCP